MLHVSGKKKINFDPFPVIFVFLPPNQILQIFFHGVSAKGAPGPKTRLLVPALTCSRGHRVNLAKLIHANNKTPKLKKGETVTLDELAIFETIVN